ncbi:MAG: hypothetical protein IKX28_01875 [Bacteroidales bacterium]|nr:hypothetical protein [Bacteroidales bacterium]
MKRLFALAVAALFGSAAALWAQDGDGGLPVDVFYLMPEMAQGSVQFRDKAPAIGKFNICAVDNTIRYNDKDGTELAVEMDDSMTRVVIGGVTFVPYNGGFLRLIPVTDEVSVAVRRNVLLLTDSKTSGYGMESQTTAVSNVMGIQSDSKYYLFDENRNVPYRLSEEAFLYRKDAVLTLTKKNFQRCFPDGKDAIEAWFSAHRKMDGSKVEEVLSLAREWAGQ